MTPGNAVIADLTGTIERRIDAGEPLERIESEILERHDLDLETKNGLALYAWAWRESMPPITGTQGRRRAVIAPIEA